MAWINIVLSILSNFVKPLLEYWEKRSEKKQARQEAQRHADTPVTPDGAIVRLRKRAKRKRKT